MVPDLNIAGLSILPSIEGALRVSSHDHESVQSVMDNWISKHMSDEICVFKPKDDTLQAVT